MCSNSANWGECSRWRHFLQTIFSALKKKKRLTPAHLCSYESAAQCIKSPNVHIKYQEWENMCWSCPDDLLGISHKSLSKIYSFWSDWFELAVKDTVTHNHLEKHLRTYSASTNQHSTADHIMLISCQTRSSIWWYLELSLTYFNFICAALLTFWT